MGKKVEGKVGERVKGKEVYVVKGGGGGEKGEDVYFFF